MIVGPGLEAADAVLPRLPLRAQIRRVRYFTARSTGSFAQQRWPIISVLPV
jgi:hypothetical protein